MKISSILTDSKISMSCELFPPKAGEALDRIKEVVRETARLNPSFISVTCGAGGTTADNTAQVAQQVQKENNVTALAHLTCAGADKTDVQGILAELKSMGICNILALRGDLPEGVPPKTDFAHASDLTEEILRQGDFCVGGACYPEGHPEAATIWQDIEHLKIKVDKGCSFLTTQMFFDNNILYNFMFRLLKNNINVPVVAGIMPVVNANQMARICKLSGTAMPPRFKAIIDRFKDKPNSMRQAGIAYATEQIIDLIANGVNNIHIYTMNKPEIAESIFKNLSDIIWS